MKEDSGHKLIVIAMQFFRGLLGAFVAATVIVSVAALEVFEVLAGAAGFGGHFPSPVNTMLSLAMTGALVGMMAAIIKKDAKFVAFFAIPYLTDLLVDSHGADVWMTGSVLPLLGAPPEVQAMRAVFFMLSAVGDVMAGYIVVAGWEDMTRIVLASFGYKNNKREVPAARPPASSRGPGAAAPRCVVCGGRASVFLEGRGAYCRDHYIHYTTWRR